MTRETVWDIQPLFDEEGKIQTNEIDEKLSHLYDEFMSLTKNE